MTATTTETGPVRPVVDAGRWARKNWPILAGLALVVGVVGYQQLGGSDAPAAAPSAVVVEREAAPAPEPTPRRDPLSGFAKPLAPVAQALVGGAFEDKAELVRRANELLGQGLTECSLYMGSDGVAWSVSAVWSASHPSPLFAGCAFPPAAKP